MENATRLIFFCIVLISIFPIDIGQKCGRLPQATKLSGKIVGGYDVGYYKYPWYAALLLDDVAWCGGTLIGPSTIVTAAHCFKEYMISKIMKLEDVFKVRLGIYNNCKAEDTQTTYKVKKVYVHEKYLKKRPYYDIALLIVDGDTSKYEEACLPSAPLKERGMEGIIIGLGTLKYAKDEYPCNLHEGRILIYPDKTCKKMIHDATDDKEDYAIVNAFCAGYLQGGVDACQGDSGGPLLVQNSEGRYVILGLTSFGYDCAQKDLLGVYTDVSCYGKWIKDTARISSQLTSTELVTTESSPSTSDIGVTTTPNEKPPNYPVTEQQSGPFVEESTEVPIYIWTLPTSKHPPMVYTEPSYNKLSSVGQGIGSLFGSSPPKRIIIEYRHSNATKKKKSHSKKYSKTLHHKERKQKMTKHHSNKKSHSSSKQYYYN